MMTRTWASELAPLNVRVNSITPGFVDTPGSRASLTQDMGVPAAILDSMLSGTGVVQSDDIARAAVFLCSDDARHVNGANLVVDSGSIVGAQTPAT
jgi:NAD(P)-dependent dehydrogenase (short-subunit alcohol dehydrogenase family)